MQTRSDAEEHLRIIRSLMEKATIYRAISAEAAAVGGIVAILASLCFYIPGDSWDDRTTLRQFMVLWLVVLAIAGLSNTVFLYGSARRRGEKFVSSGMRVALRALAPSFIVAGFFTAFLGGFIEGNITRLIAFEWIVPIWITCYGVALLATTNFAPRSLGWLGWAFLAAGLAAFTQVAATRFHVLGTTDFHPIETPYLNPFVLSSSQRWMGATFGLFHLIYAACTWPRRVRGAAASGKP